MVNQSNRRLDKFFKKISESTMPFGVLNAMYDDNNNPRQVAVGAYSSTIGTTRLDNNNSGNNFNFNTAGAQITITSTSAQDGNSGTGLNTILIRGLNTSWDEINEVVALNGTGGVTTSNTFLRINSVIVLNFGSSGSAVGTITATGDSFTWFKYLPLDTDVELGRYSIPRGYTLVLTSFAWTCGQSGDFTIYGMVKTQSTPLQSVAIYPVSNNSDLWDGIATKIPEKSDIVMRSIRRTGGGGGQELSITFVGWLFNNSLTN